MLRTLILLLLPLTWTADLRAQDRPEGTYSGLDDLLAAKPTGSVSALREVHRWKIGTESYVFRDRDGSSIDPVRNIFLVFHDTLYMALDAVGYVRMLEQGALCYFRSWPYSRLEAERCRDMRKPDPIWRVDIISAPDPPRERKARVHYVLSLSEGLIHALTPEFIRKCLADEPEMLETFNHEPAADTIDVLVGYLRYCNTRQLQKASVPQGR